MTSSPRRCRFRSPSRCEPSVEAEHQHRIARQKEENLDAVLNRRPAHMVPPPITIYHPVFADFLRNMSSTPPLHEFDDDEIENARSFLFEAQDLYQDNVSRVWGSGTGLRAAVHKALLHVTDLYVDPCIEVDGVVETTASTPNGFHPVSALAVVQTEFGTAKTDPAA